MYRLRPFFTVSIVLFVVALLGWKVIASAEPTPLLLRGELWQTMSLDTKVAYVWGMSNLVEFERALSGTLHPDSKSFFPFLIKGLSGKSIAEVVQRIDAYFAQHPDQLKRPVVDALFQAVVLPTLNPSQEGGGSQ
jgi:hypothetical protein